MSEPDRLVRGLTRNERRAWDELSRSLAEHGPEFVALLSCRPSLCRRAFNCAWRYVLECFIGAATLGWIVPPEHVKEAQQWIIDMRLDGC